jgi:hypothetical protein
MPFLTFFNKPYHIGFETFGKFFPCFEKGGCSKDAFIKAIHQFLDAETAKQWEDKYLEYIILFGQGE